MGWLLLKGFESRIESLDPFSHRISFFWITPFSCLVVRIASWWRGRGRRLQRPVIVQQWTAFSWVGIGTIIGGLLMASFSETSGRLCHRTLHQGVGHVDDSSASKTDSRQSNRSHKVNGYSALMRIILSLPWQEISRHLSCLLWFVK